MEIGEVIRKYRKANQMTQEDMARRLGVTAPAVNKWENGNSCPDVMMLAPIARLLGITVDTLLSFQEELTKDEIRKLVEEADRKMKENTYDEAYEWVRKVLEKYPKSEELILYMAAILDARGLLGGDRDEEKEKYICSLYGRALESREERIRHQAADALFWLHIRNEEYEKAEKYLEYFSEENPERKRKKGELLRRTGRIQEAYRVYEELLFAYYQMTSGILQGMYSLALEEKDKRKARLIMDKQRELAKCFEMGR
ncbi:MAG: helix-turn-helix transcriptional regulator [Blautia sp.]|jgi:transcriptional regulator with XRE-family HTH domain